MQKIPAERKTILAKAKITLKNLRHQQLMQLTCTISKKKLLAIKKKYTWQPQARKFSKTWENGSSVEKIVLIINAIQKQIRTISYEYHICQ